MAVDGGGLVKRFSRVLDRYAYLSSPSENGNVQCEALIIAFIAQASAVEQLAGSGTAAVTTGTGEGAGAPGSAVEVLVSETCD